jgi:hypothetical protein
MAKVLRGGHDFRDRAAILGRVAGQHVSEIMRAEDWQVGR